MVKIVLVTGGTRSGKSSFTMGEGEKLSGPRVYLATAENRDAEMAKRIDAHKRQRGLSWDTHEEPLNISGAITSHKKRYGVILLDCLTLWLSNVLHRACEAGKGAGKYDAERDNESDIETDVETEIEAFTRFLLDIKGQSSTCTLYMVTNEVGMGIVPENKLARLFRDLSGRLNQSVASVSDEVYLVVCGLASKIKG
ncbi:MAG: bifunctional adenosylcobinamide kinase/adenosylcobinamide-phosphate guanylyltransferase [Nitrospirae bacterium]|nr:bifunctional adenosylcobinamide kinase/adenosylcobinamide-phosphate guanylyltransferase [Nitrospirota bacterium]